MKPAKSISSSPRDNVAHIKQAVKRAFIDTQSAIELEELLETGANRTLERSRHAKINETFDGKLEVATINTINLLLVREITMCLTRIYDKPGRDRASLGEIFFRMENENVRNLIFQERKGIIQFQFGEDVGQWLERIKARWVRFRTTNFASDLKSLFDARDTYIAHSLLQEPELPNYGRLFSMVRETEEIVGELSALLGNTTIGFKSSRKIYRKRAAEFWDTLIAGGKQRATKLVKK